jgi:hypothetical protein
MSTKSARLPCGCLVERDRERLIACCALHEREWQELHQRAQAERVETMREFDRPREAA